ncbi:DUF397 domain-containing protein [Streptomyces sp. NPDC001407]|uniref:DUF397 domain-containing protein n=1 Tax=Streptomyces sp. NPDC001407 TaxID=3364573 RepID=UPI0036C2CE3A
MTRASNFAAMWQKSSYSTNGGNCVEVASSWRKSTYSGPNGGDCVEVAANWRKSSYSSNNGGECVEIADNIPNAIPIRDSKNPDGPALLVTPAAWTSFLGGIKSANLGVIQGSGSLHISLS